VVACEPNEPAADDATCDGIDDNCDGRIDEDCAEIRNILGVNVSEVGPDHHIVELAFGQNGQLDGRMALWPALAAVEFDLGPGYRIAGNDAVVAGPSAARHAPTIQIDPDNRGAVLFFLDLQGNQIPPGVLVTMRLELEAGDRTVTLDPAGTFFAPEAAQDALSFSNIE